MANTLLLLVFSVASVLFSDRAPAEASTSKTIPLPWTVGQIKKATKQGTKLKYRIYAKEEDVEATAQKVLEIVAVSDAGLTVQSTQSYPDGTPTSEITKKPRIEEFTWESWAEGFGFGKTAFNEGDTKVTEESVTVPAGTFLCKVYTKVEVEEGGDNMTTVWAFVKDQPGRFVKLNSTYTEQDEPPEIESMELLEVMN